MGSNIASMYHTIRRERIYYIGEMMNASKVNNHTVNKITTIPNSVNAAIVNEFYQYMGGTGASEHH